MTWSFAEFTVFGEICLLTLSSWFCVVGFVRKAHGVCRVVSRSGTFRRLVSEVC